MNYIFYIMGKSSAGKDTIYKLILDDLLERSEINIKPIIIYTTRPMRSGETNGVEYHFVNDKLYNDMYKKGKILESRKYNTSNGPWVYFTSSDVIDLESNNYIGIGTLESYTKLCEYYGTETMVPIYIETPDEYVRALRALNRERNSNKDYAEMYRRLRQDLIDFSEDNLKKAGICELDRFINGNLESCVRSVFGRIYYTILGAE